MVRLLLAAVAAATLCVSHAAGQSVVQRTDWQDRRFETYLPKLDVTVPWLELDTKTKLPKGNIPIGRDVASFPPFVLPLLGADILVSTNVSPAFRSM